MNKIIFLEGPAFSGKTTFLRQAPEDIVRLPEASEFLGGDAYFPDAPIDAKTMAYCSYFFAVMDNMRFEGIDNDKQNSLVLVDRFTPLSSMIFYALRHANGDISESDYRLGIRFSTRQSNYPLGIVSLFDSIYRHPKYCLAACLAVRVMGSWLVGEPLSFITAGMNVYCLFRPNV